MIQLYPDHSPNEGVNAGEGANVNIVRLLFGEKGKEIFYGIVLGISIVVNIIAIFAWRDAATEQRVKQYELQFFETHEFAEVKAQIQTNQALIQAYGLQKVVKEK